MLSRFYCTVEEQINYTLFFLLYSFLSILYYRKSNHYITNSTLNCFTHAMTKQKISRWKCRR